MGINLCTIQNTSLPDYEVLKEGWLYKKSPMFDSYSKKWVVISRNPQTCLLCFKDDQKKPKDLSVFMRFSEVEFSSLIDQGMQFAQKKGSNKWTFYAADDDEYENWLRIIKFLTRDSDVIKHVKESHHSNNWTMLIVEDEEYKHSVL